MTTLNPTWPEFNVMAKEFFQALPELDEEQAENGFKCLSLGYLGLKDATEIEEHQAVMVIKIAGRKLFEHNVNLIAQKVA